MPRIAAAIGVFATVAVFTFINIKSYPVVWEMVGTAPWFAQGEESSRQEISAQAEMVAEEAVEEADSSRPNPSPSVPPLPKLKSLAGNAAKDNGSSSDSSLRTGPATTSGPATSGTATSGTATSGKGAYPGLNLGPIKITETVSEAADADNYVLGKMTAGRPTGSVLAPPPAPSGSRWPAEMSPRMKYAAKPPILETYQNWNPERPLVPVQRPKKLKKTQKPGNDKQGKSAKDASPDHKDSSRFKRPVYLKRPVYFKRPVEPGNGFGKVIVRHLPPVDPQCRPIRMSIPAHGPNSPIPVYPGTGR